MPKNLLIVFLQDQKDYFLPEFALSFQYIIIKGLQTMDEDDFHFAEYIIDGNVDLNFFDLEYSNFINSWPNSPEPYPEKEVIITTGRNE